MAYSYKKKENGKNNTGRPEKFVNSKELAQIRNSWNQLIIELNEWSQFRRQVAHAGNMA